MSEEASSEDLAARFADAFNARDLDAMTALLAPEATAQVLGSPFPVEERPATIRATSFAYLLAEEDGSLQAEPVRHAGTDYVLLRKSAGVRALDCVARLRVLEARIEGIEYLVSAFRKSELASLAAALGLPLAEP